MKPIYSLFVAALMLFPSFAFSEDLGLMRLSLVDGDVQVLIKDSTDWTDATINVPLNERDRLWVPDDGKVELQIRGGVFVRGDGSTALDILTVNQDSAQLFLDRGHLYISNLRGGIKTVQVDALHTSLRSYDNSIIMIDVASDGTIEVSVLKGLVYAESRSGATRVGAGNTLTIRGDNDAELAPIDAPDEWERWNRARDERLSTWGESSRYLPDELHEYSYDFDNNGRWSYVRDYGYVWVPTVTVVEWAPYTLGRWVWIRGHHVWIAYDPWGWAPYHYGRWAHIAAHDWCWVPPVRGAAYWGPGFVGWIVTPEYVSWVPLAPGEIYYGYGYYGPSSVNIMTVNIKNVRVNRSYRNAAVRNSVVVVRRDTFGTGRRDAWKTSDNPFLAPRREHGANVNVVPPQTRPQRPIVVVQPEMRDQLRQRRIDRESNRPEAHENQRPVAPATPSAAPTPSGRIDRPPAAPSGGRRTTERVLPPERVRNTQPDEFKNERRLVKEREASVFKSRQPENLPVRKMNEPRTIDRKSEQRQKTDQNDRNEGRGRR